MVRALGIEKFEKIDQYLERKKPETVGTRQKRDSEKSRKNRSSKNRIKRKTASGEESEKKEIDCKKITPEEKQLCLDLNVQAKTYCAVKNLFLTKQITSSGEIMGPHGKHFQRDKVGPIITFLKSHPQLINPN